MCVLRTPAGVEEDITLAFGYSGDETLPLDTVEELATALDAEHRLVTLLTALRAARRDLTVPPSSEAPPIPVTFTLAVTRQRASIRPVPGIRLTVPCPRGSAAGANPPFTTSWATEPTPTPGACSSASSTA